MDNTRQTKSYYVDGLGKIQLGQQEFKAQGGEAAVFKVGNIGVKIYHDPSKMITIQKIKELSALDHPSFIKPERLVFKSPKSKKPVGFTMQWADDIISLCKLFVKTFRKNNNITPEMVVKLVQYLQMLVSYAHNRNVLIVDLSEPNFLCTNTFDALWAIDVNAYETANFRGPVLTPLFRDYQGPKDATGRLVFSENTDWFSFAVLSCWMLLGVHPYKGGHPDFAHVNKKIRTISRMQQNVSVFDAKSTLPAASQPFDAIPAALRQWFVAVLQEGKRMPPPTDYDAAIQIIMVANATSGSKLFEIKELAAYQEEIVDVLRSGRNRFVISKNKAWWQGQEMPSPQGVVGFANKSQKPVVATIENKRLKLYDIVQGRDILITSYADAIMGYDGRLYVQVGINILQIELDEVGTKVIASMKKATQVVDAPNATQIFDGVILQNILGRYLVTIFPSQHDRFQINLEKLSGYRVLDAKFQNQVLVIMLEKGGIYSRCVMRFESDFQHKDVRFVEDVDFSAINFAVNKAGICVILTEEEELEVFQNKPGAAVKIMPKDPAITGDCQLRCEGSSMTFFRGKKLYGFTMRKK